jgi:PIN domain nuclease of toxin-antitoxin system
VGRSGLILLDTHVVVWLGLDPARISKNARAAIDQARQSASGLAISDMTLLELTRITSLGRLDFRASLEAFLSDVERKFVVLPMTGRICMQALALPASYPKDPSDRVIGATALVEGLSLLTADREIRKSRAVPTIW